MPDLSNKAQSMFKIKTTTQKLTGDNAQHLLLICVVTLINLKLERLITVFQSHNTIMYCKQQH